MNVNSMQNRFPDDAGRQTAAVVFEADNRSGKGFPTMDPGNSAQKVSDTAFRKRFDDVVRANSDASRGRDSMNERTKDLHETDRSRQEVVERARLPHDRRVELNTDHSEQPVTPRQAENSGSAKEHKEISGWQESRPVDDSNTNQSEKRAEALGRALAKYAADTAKAADAGDKSLPAESSVAPSDSPDIAKPLDIPAVIDPAAAQQAASLLISSIVTVSESLNINVSEGVYHLDLNDPGESSIKEIAEILYSLKGIAGVMENALASDKPVELNGGSVQGASLVELAKEIRQAIFQIETAVNLLGVSADVSSQVAEKSNSGTGIGITVAIDPLTRSMPAGYIEKILGGKTEDAMPTMQTLVDRLASVMNNGDGRSVSQITAAFAQKVLTGQADVNALKQVKPVDPAMMRAMLKVDGSPTAAENQKAAGQSEKMDLPHSFGITMGRSLLDESQVGDDQTAAVVGKMTDIATQSANGLFAPAKLSRTVDTPEESVLTQIVSKFSSLLKAGGTHEIKMMLHPRELGDVHLSVKIDGDVVTAKIQVESQQVKQIIESNLQSLKSALAEHDFKSGSFSVNVDSGAGRNLSEEAAQNAQDRKEGQGPGRRNGNEDADLTIPGTNAAHSAGDPGRDTGKRYGDNSFEFYA